MHGFFGHWHAFDSSPAFPYQTVTIGEQIAKGLPDCLVRGWEYVQAWYSVYSWARLGLNISWTLQIQMYLWGSKLLAKWFQEAGGDSPLPSRMYLISSSVCRCSSKKDLIFFSYSGSLSGDTVMMSCTSGVACEGCSNIWYSTESFWLKMCFDLELSCRNCLSLKGILLISLQAPSEVLASLNWQLEVSVLCIWEWMTQSSAKSWDWCSSSIIST